MQQIVSFFIRHKNTLSFLLLLGIASFFFIQSHTLQKMKFINSANWITGYIYNVSNTINAYFSLRKNNTLLLEENKKLREALFNEKAYGATDTFALENYKVITASVIKNSFSKNRNYLTIKAALSGVAQDMGVITPRGILGIVEDASGPFAVVQSILNERSEINAKVKRTHHFGTLKWDTDHYTTVQLVDIPRLAAIKVGDTIVTGGMSAIFPEGIPIGVIKDFRLDASQNYFMINVSLFNDMTAVEYVYVIDHIQKDTILTLQQTLEDDE